MEIQYNQPIEVSREKYTLIKKRFSGLVAFRTENGKFFIKSMTEKYIPHLKQALS